MLDSVLSYVVAVGKTQGLQNLDLTIPAPLPIGLGAIFGALSRYYLTLYFARWLGTAFPYGTLFINLTGSGLIGFFTTWVTKLMPDSAALQWLIAVGFLGSYTTFSTYALDSANLFRTRSYQKALFYWWGSPVLGFVSVELGMFLARQI